MIRARSFFPGVLAAFAFLWYPGLLAGAQGVADREIFDGRSLAAGFDIGVNSSGGRTDWLKPDRDSMKMAYPSNQAWGSVFITFGSPKSPPRPSIDMSEFATLLVEVRGDPGTTIEIGIKDSTQPDDGTEAKVIIPVFSDFRTYAVPLTKFNRVDLRRTYVVTEFVLSGPQAQAVWFRRIGYTTNPSPASDVVLNAASQSPGAGLGSWISVVGQNFSGMTRVWGIDDFQSGKLPRSIEGISVALNDRDLAVQLISPDRVNALVFPSVSAGQSYFSVTNSLGTSVPLRVVVQDNDPAFFAVPDEGKKYAFAKHLDGTLVGRSGLFGPGLVARPARPGDTVNIFGTGFGRTDQTTPSDEALFGTHPLVDPTLVVLHVGASAALIVWAGAVRPGVYVVRAVVPNVEAGDQRLIIDLGRSKSLKEVYMTVQR